MRRGTIYIERPALRDPETGLNPHIGRIAVTFPVTTEDDFKHAAKQLYESEGVQVSFGPIGAPWV